VDRSRESSAKIDCKAAWRDLRNLQGELRLSYWNLTAAFPAISCSRAIRGVVVFPGEQIVKIRLVAFSTILLLGDIEFAMVNIADPGISRVNACYLGSIKTPPLLVA
jgi:hypothetical protein